MRAAGEHGHGRVVTHGPGGLAAVLRHGLDDHGDVLRGVTSRRLRLDERHGVHLRLPRGLGDGERLNLGEPGLVVAAARHLLGHLGVLLEVARLEVRLDHLAGAEATLGDDVLGVGDDVAEDANLRRDVDVVIRGAPETSGAETVAVEAAAELLAVGEDEEGGAVPRLLHAGEVIVKRLNLGVGGVELGVVAVRLGDEEHHRLRDGAAGLDEELGDAVEVGGVGRGGVADGAELVLAAVPYGVGHVRLLGRHPVEVTLEGVDLTVVAEEAHGLRQGPLGHGVGGEAAVVDAELRLEVLILEVEVELANHGGAEHTLVHDGATGHGAHVEVLGDAGHLGVEARGGFLSRLARDEELALELIALGAVDEHLLDDGLGVLRHAADDILIHRNLPPAEDGETLRGDGSLEDLLTLGRLGLVLGKEHHADAGGALGEALDAVVVAPLAEHLPRHVAHDARAVAGVVVRGARAAVLHAAERGERVGDGLVRAFTLEGGDETDAARVALLEDLVHVHGAARVGGAGLGGGEDDARAGSRRGGRLGRGAEPADSRGTEAREGSRWSGGVRG